MALVPQVLTTKHTKNAFKKKTTRIVTVNGMEFPMLSIGVFRVFSWFLEKDQEPARIYTGLDRIQIMASPAIGSQASTR